MFVLFLFGHCNVCPFSLWSLTMAKEKNDKHYNGQREKGQTLQ
jgi:hypothetical protein